MHEWIPVVSLAITAISGMAVAWMGLKVKQAELEQAKLRRATRKIVAQVTQQAVASEKIVATVEEQKSAIVTLKDHTNSIIKDLMRATAEAEGAKGKEAGIEQGKAEEVKRAGDAATNRAEGVVQGKAEAIVDAGKDSGSKVILVPEKDTVAAVPAPPEIH